MSDSVNAGLKAPCGSDRYLMRLEVVVQLLVVFDSKNFSQIEAESSISDALPL